MSQRRSCCWTRSIILFLLFCRYLGDTGFAPTRLFWLRGRILGRKTPFTWCHFGGEILPWFHVHGNDLRRERMRVEKYEQKCTHGKWVLHRHGFCVTQCLKLFGKMAAAVMSGATPTAGLWQKPVITTGCQLLSHHVPCCADPCATMSGYDGVTSCSADDIIGLKVGRVTRSLLLRCWCWLLLPPGGCKDNDSTFQTVCIN